MEHFFFRFRPTFKEMGGRRGLALLMIAPFAYAFVPAPIFTSPNLCPQSMAVASFPRNGVQSERRRKTSLRNGELRCCESGMPGSPQQSGLCDAAARRYWDGMNRRDVDFALEQFSDDIFFQDMLFQEPIRGKAQLREHFERCLSGFPAGLLFVIDEISIDAGDGRSGAYWHCETPDGKPFPFSRGLSFYKVDAAGKLCFAREIPEPATKPGSSGLALARLGAFLMRFVPDSLTFPKI